MPRTAGIPSAVRTLVEPRQHVVADPLFFVDLALQAQVLGDESRLLCERVEEPAVVRAVRFLRLLVTEQPHSRQPIGAVGDRHDHRDAQTHQPARLGARKPCLLGQRNVDDTPIRLQPG